MVDLAPFRPPHFYDALYGEVADGFVAISALDQSRVGEKGSWNDTVEAVPLGGEKTGEAIAAAVERVVALGPAQNVYFTPAPRRTNKRGGISNTASIAALWAEFDSVTSSPGKDPATSFLNVGEVNTLFFQPGFPEPTHIISSGNGWHCYWRLEEPLAWPGPDQDTAHLLARWGNFIIDLGARRGKHVDRVFDAARVLRCPGTFNHKSDPPVPVELISVNGQVISVGDLDDLLPPLDEYTDGLWSQTYDTSGIKTSQVVEWLDAHSGQSNREGTQRVKEAVQKLADAHAGGRHDSLLSALASVIQPQKGKAVVNVNAALGELEATFTKIKPDAEGSEFRNMVRYLVGQRIREGEEKAASVVSVADLRQSAVASDDLFFLDWAKLGNEEDDTDLWLIPGLIARGLNTLQSRAGVGKSMVTLAMALGLATGRSVLGFAHPTGEPIDVCYFDWEMGPNDVTDRLYTLGFDLDDDDLSHLHYSLYPPFDVDSQEGAKVMLDRVVATDTQVAVFDTMQRAISAPENDADGWRDAMRFAWTPLKQLGVTVIRLDHLGKVKKRGGRGSSSKRDEADLIWDLTQKGEGAARVLTFNVNKTRIVLPAGKVEVGWRMDDHGRIDFTADAADPIFTAPSERVIKIVAEMDNAGVPLDLGRRKVRRLIHFKGGDAVLGEAVTFRKRREAELAPPVAPLSEGDTETGLHRESAPSLHHSEGPAESSTSKGDVAVQPENLHHSAPEGRAYGLRRGTPIGVPRAHRLGPEPLLCPECGETEMVFTADREALVCAACDLIVPTDHYPYQGEGNENPPAADPAPTPPPPRRS